MSLTKDQMRVLRLQQRQNGGPRKNVSNDSTSNKPVWSPGASNNPAMSLSSSRSPQNAGTYISNNNNNHPENRNNDMELVSYNSTNPLAGSSESSRRSPLAPQELQQQQAATAAEKPSLFGVMPNSQIERGLGGSSGEYNNNNNNNNNKSAAASAKHSHHHGRGGGGADALRQLVPNGTGSGSSDGDPVDLGYSSSSLDEVYRNEAGDSGLSSCNRCIVRLPFPPSIFILIPLLVLIAFDLDEVVTSRQELNFVREHQDMIEGSVRCEQALMAERGRSTLRLAALRPGSLDATNAVSFDSVLEEARNLTDKECQFVLAEAKESSDPQLNAAFAISLAQILDLELPSKRAEVDSNIISPTQARIFYTFRPIDKMSSVRLIAARNEKMRAASLDLMEMHLEEEAFNQLGLCRAIGGQILTFNNWTELNSIAPEVEGELESCRSTFDYQKQRLQDLVGGLTSFDLEPSKLKAGTWQRYFGPAWLEARNVTADQWFQVFSDAFAAKTLNLEFVTTIESRMNRSVLIVVIGLAFSFVCTVLSVFAQLRQTKLLQGALSHSRRHLAASRTIIEMSSEIVQRLARYDTDSVRSILSIHKATVAVVQLRQQERARRQKEANKSGGGDGGELPQSNDTALKLTALLIESFEKMNDNLEKYKPFLPNYLFLDDNSGSSSDDSDEEDEGGDGTADPLGGSKSESKKRKKSSDQLGESDLSSIGSYSGYDASMRVTSINEGPPGEDQALSGTNTADNNSSSNAPLRSALKKKTSSFEFTNNNNNNRTADLPAPLSSAERSSRASVTIPSARNVRFDQHSAHSSENEGSDNSSSLSQKDTEIQAMARSSHQLLQKAQVGSVMRALTGTVTQQAAKGRVTLALVDIKGYVQAYAGAMGNDLAIGSSYDASVSSSNSSSTTNLMANPGGGANDRRPSSSLRSRQQQQQFAVHLPVVADIVYLTAQRTKGSVHSMLGDQVVMSWNATNKVPSPESKACHFMLDLRQSLVDALQASLAASTGSSRQDNRRMLKKSTSSIALLRQLGVPMFGAAIASGPSTVHSVTTKRSRQQALVIENDWWPVLEGCFELGRRYNTVIADDNTRRVAHYHYDLRPVDSLVHYRDQTLKEKEREKQRRSEEEQQKEAAAAAAAAANESSVSQNNGAAGSTPGQQDSEPHQPQEQSESVAATLGLPLTESINTDGSTSTARPPSQGQQSLNRAGQASTAASPSYLIPETRRPVFFECDYATKPLPVIGNDTKARRVAVYELLKNMQDIGEEWLYNLRDNPAGSEMSKNIEVRWAAIFDRASLQGQYSEALNLIGGLGSAIDPKKLQSFVDVNLTEVTKAQEVQKGEKKEEDLSLALASCGSRQLVARFADWVKEKARPDEDFDGAHFSMIQPTRGTD